MSNPAPIGPSQMPEAWSAAAPNYSASLGAWRAYADEALRLVPLGPTDVALDVATGPGTLALVAARRAARVVAVDFAPGMIEELAARAAAEGVKNVDAAVMDAQALALDDARFDAAYCMFGFMFFPDRAKAFREMHRVLEPGGRALVATWAPIERRPIMKIAFDAMREALPQIPPPAKGDLQTMEECESEMSGAGFRDVKVHAVTASLRFDSPKHFLDVVGKAGVPYAMMKKTLGDAAMVEIEERLLGAIRKRIPADGATLSAEALLTVGTR